MKEDFPGTTGSETTSGEVAAPSYTPTEGSRLETVLGGADLEFLLRGLPEQDQEVILRRNGLGGYEKTTLDRTGQLMNYSREWIRRLENRALWRLGIIVNEQRTWPKNQQRPT